MPFLKGWASIKRGAEKKQTVLERKTADLREKLARISFRRHSAPARDGSSGSCSQEKEPAYYGSSQPAVVDPQVLCQLPTPVLELVLDQLSLKELVSGAALVHTSWHKMIMSDDFWRRRLAAELPSELLRHFNRWRGAWPCQAAKFFSSNLVLDPEFAPQNFSVATGNALHGNNWRVQVGCWQTESIALGKVSQQLARSCSSNTKHRVLVLNTPNWAAPEATQDVDLMGALVNQGMGPGAAAAYLDTCPTLSFSVWCYCGTQQPASWHRGYAVVVLDNGRDCGTGWQGVRLGSRMSTNESLAYWISWAPEDSLLRGCNIQPKQYMFTERGQFKRLACVFTGYNKGVRRAHILLKGLNPQNVYSNGKDMNYKEIKPATKFVAPCLRFVMPEA